MFQLLCVGINYLVFLEGFECTEGASRNIACLIVTKVASHSWIILRLVHRRVTLNEVDSVSVNDPVVAASDSEVVGDEFDWPFEWGCHPRLSWASEHWSVLFLS